MQSSQAGHPPSPLRTNTPLFALLASPPSSVADRNEPHPHAPRPPLPPTPLPPRPPPSSAGKKVQEYVEALQKGGVDKKVAQAVISKWQEAGGQDADPATLRRLFLRQSSIPLLAAAIQAGGGAWEGGRPKAGTAGQQCTFEARMRGQPSGLPSGGVPARPSRAPSLHVCRSTCLPTRLPRPHAPSPNCPQTLVDAAAAYSIFMSGVFFG